MVGVGEAKPFAAEGHEPFQWWRLGSKGRGPEQERLLAGPLVLVEQHHHQPGPAAEPPEHRALPDACGCSDVVHRDRLGAALGDEPARGIEQQRPVARGVTALLRCGHRQPAELFDAHFVHFNAAGINRTVVRLSRGRMDNEHIEGNLNGGRQSIGAGG